MDSTFSKSEGVDVRLMGTYSGSPKTVILALNPLPLKFRPFLSDTRDQGGKIGEICLLTKQSGWYGKHSGYYQQLPRYLAKISSNVNSITPRRNLVSRMVGKVYANALGWPPRDQSLTFAELAFRRRLKKSPSAIGHVLNFEEHYFLFHSEEKTLKNVIATIHLPPASWCDLMQECLLRLRCAIALCQRDLKNLENRIGEGRVRFIPHGVDTDFFKPGVGFEATPSTPRLVFAGQYLRNTAMLKRVVAKLRAAHPNLTFDFVVAKHVMAMDGFRELRALSGVNWHHCISDEALLSLYQNSYLMLLPMDDSGANNSVVEALSTGLPVVTTDVGGIRDYGGSAIFPLVANNDDEGMIALVERYLAKPQWRQLIAEQTREFAVTSLRWPVIAEKHLQVYRELLPL